MNNRQRKTKITAVEESEYGTYVWYTDDRKMLKDDEGRFLCVASKKGDRRILDAFKNAAHGFMKDMGAEPNGHAMFLSGHRPITDEQYEEQKAREAMGLVPDPFDIGAANDELKELRVGDRR